MNKLEGKTAVITGGTTGIGFETARHYLNEGAKVLVTGRSKEKLDKAVSELGAGAYGVVADASSVAALSNLAKEVEEKFGKLDVLFVNAGSGVFSPIEQIDEESFDSQFDLNVKGLFFTVQKLLPLMGAGGSIILNASAVNGKGAPGGSLYFASKAAVRSFARSMAAELGPKGIRVNALSPGLVPTKFFSNSNLGEGGYDDFSEMVISSTPLGRAGKPEEIASAAVFLASDQSSYVTAADLVVDGGFMNV